MNIRILFLMVMVALLSANPAFAMEGSAIVPIQPLPTPHFDPISQTQLHALFEKANKGDTTAQDEIVQRNYWNFLNRDQLEADEVFIEYNTYDPLSWVNIETRAIQDPLYAFTLINSYSRLTKNSPGNPSFPDKFPDLFKAIQEKATAEYPDAQFNLGVIYQQFSRSPQHIGLQAMTSQGVNTLAYEQFLKAKAHGHSHAPGILGILCYRGSRSADYHVGRNSAEALRWFFASKSNPSSQGAIKRILGPTPEGYQAFQQFHFRKSKNSQTPQEETFQEELKVIKLQLMTLLEEHSFQTGLHNPRGEFSENPFSIPELSTLYQKVVEVEEEAIRLIASLQTSTPGFMINAFTIAGYNPEQLLRLIPRQSQPHFISIDVRDGVTYLTLGEENVRIAAHFLTYLKETERKFAAADTILQEDSQSYKSRLQTHFAKLKEQRLLCLASQEKASRDPSEVNRETLKVHAHLFEKQQKKYEERRLTLSTVIQKIETERTLLTEVKGRVTALLFRSIGKRNQDFLKENPFW